MLLRFAVENHLSIRERQELSFAASSLKDRSDGLLSCDAVSGGAVVPAVVIYGANASGKTNFMNAVSAMKRLVLLSQTKGEPGGGVPRHRFLLDPGFSEKPSCFEIDFVLDGMRYHYGFETTDDAFTSEWLYEIPKAHHRKLYERKGQNFAFGRSLKGQNRNIAGLNRSNSLFLSAAAQNNHEYLSRIYKYFRDILFSGSIDVQELEVYRQFIREGLDQRIIEFLKSINTGVIGFRERDIEMFEESQAFQREFLDLAEKFLGAKIKREMEEVKCAKIELAHRGKNGEIAHLDFDRESAGTRRLMIILAQVFRALDRGLPVFIDELDVSLHTYVGKSIIRLFCSPKVNRNGAQLIATTHDTNLMDTDMLRRDQLWFAEKNTEGATEIYPLTDIRTRKGDNVELGYLQGRYGAVPSDDPVAAVLRSD